MSDRDFAARDRLHLEQTKLSGLRLDNQFDC